MPWDGATRFDMHSRPSSGLRSASEGDSPPHLLRVALLSVVVGIITGGIASIFRIVLKAADLARTHWLTESSSPKFLRFLVAAALISTAAAIAAWLVRRFAPKAVGSGIPQVEAAVSGDAPPAGPSILPVKFIGGILAIGGGLALGREGPSVQMGAALGTLAGRYFRLGQVDTLALLAAGAGAGLATAFNAPIAGAVLVFRDITELKQAEDGARQGGGQGEEAHVEIPPEQARRIVEPPGDLEGDGVQGHGVRGSDHRGHDPVDDVGDVDHEQGEDDTGQGGDGRGAGDADAGAEDEGGDGDRLPQKTRHPVEQRGVHGLELGPGGTGQGGAGGGKAQEKVPLYRAMTPQERNINGKIATEDEAVRGGTIIRGDHDNDTNPEKQGPRQR